MAGEALYTDERFPIFTGNETTEAKLEEIYQYLFRVMERQTYNAEHTATRKWVQDNFVRKS